MSRTPTASRRLPRGLCACVRLSSPKCAGTGQFACLLPTLAVVAVYQAPSVPAIARVLVEGGQVRTERELRVNLRLYRRRARIRGLQFLHDMHAEVNTRKSAEGCIRRR